MDVNTCFATTSAYRELALYSHLLPALAALILGIFAFLRSDNKLKGGVFLVFAIGFALWLLGDMIIWTTDNYYHIAPLWAPLDYIEIVFFLALLYFIFVDLFKESKLKWLQIGTVLAALPPFLLTVFGISVYEFNQPMCEMMANNFLADYKAALETIILGIALVAGAYKFMQARHNRAEQIRIALVVLSVVLFMGIFAGSEYIATLTSVFETNLYALFTLPIFILMLTIAITSYGTFRFGDVAVRVLFYIFLVLAGTQFFFVQSMIDFLLAAMSFGVVLVLGLLLFRAVGKEMRARQIIEKQENELEVANKQQETLLHFISHEIKGYLSKNEAGFAAITEGDYGAVSDKLSEMARGALADTREGVETVMDILSAANLQKGTVNYAKKEFDFGEAVKRAADDMRKVAEEKSVSFSFINHESKPVLVLGDEHKLRNNVVRNVIDNSIRYTPAGSIKVELSRAGGIARLSVEDTGVGISAEDMPNLFKEGGHGKESIKVNVHSTGYGLFIAKSVVEAHRGKIWAESDGPGKGSRFIVELPVAL